MYFIGNVLIVELTKHRAAIVDARDYPLVAGVLWWASEQARGHNWYAEGMINGQRTFMHRLLCPSLAEVDHRNGNGLCNLRSNLRAATRAQNAANVRVRSHSRSGIKGVAWDEKRKRWKAHISVAGKTVNIGRFLTAKEAADAYDRAAIATYGEFARTNRMLGTVP